MREWEVVKALDILHFLFIGLSFVFLVLQNLVGLDEGIGLVHLVYVLVVHFFVHLLSLELKKSLLILSLLDFV